MARRLGDPCWGSIVSKINEGLRSNDFLAVILSPNSVQSAWVEKELNVALMAELDERRVTVLPILLQDCKIPPLLRDKKFADFRRDFRFGLTELLKTIVPEIFVERAKQVTGGVVGLDFGTTNSCAAVMRARVATTILNREGSKTTPSAVALTRDNEWIAGLPAVLQAETNSNQTFFSIKRHFGTDRVFAAGGRAYKAFEIASHVFRKLREDSELFLGKAVTKAVLTCPAHFSFRERADLLEAARLGGFEILRMVAEPTAAILAYEIQEPGDNDLVIVYDLGGGSLDISIAELGDGVVEVKAMWGDTHLGGDDFDDRLVNFCLAESERAAATKLELSARTTRRVRTEVEKAKIVLSTASSATVFVPYAGQMISGEPFDMNVTISIEQFEQITSDLIERSIECCRLALRDFELPPGMIQRLEAAEQPIPEHIKREIDRIKSLTPEQLVSEAKKRVHKVILSGLPTRMPLVRQALRSLFHKAPVCRIDPDDVVAFGAATQAGVLEGVVRDTLLLDCVPFSVGVQLNNGTFYPIVYRDTTLPFRRPCQLQIINFGTQGATIKLFEGENEDCGQNGWLGTFKVAAQAPARKDVKCEITLDADANSSLTVIVNIPDLGIEKSFAVTAASIHNVSLKDEISNLQMVDSSGKR